MRFGRFADREGFLIGWGGPPTLSLRVFSTCPGVKDGLRPPASPAASRSLTPDHVEKDFGWLSGRRPGCGRGEPLRAKGRLPRAKENSFAPPSRDSSSGKKIPSASRAHPRRRRLTRRTKIRSPTAHSPTPAKRSVDSQAPTQPKFSAPNPCRRPDSQPKFSATAGVKDRRRRPAKPAAAGRPLLRTPPRTPSPKGSAANPNHKTPRPAGVQKQRLKSRATAPRATPSSAAHTPSTSTRRQASRTTPPGTWA
ncbi:hypothetical protein SAMN05428985_11290 [Nocardioides sp. YR527]|nr:hypothetical protein SAMN05428985_11290 [Nocardioides sp. YR527]